MSIFRSLKDGKRRALENVLEATGQSEKTIDENFEVDLAQYNELIHYISNSKQAIKSLIESQKHHFDTIIQHAGYLNDLHENNNNPKNTNYTVIFLLLAEQCQSYLSIGNKLNTVYGPASESILNHYTIQPLDELLTSVTTEVNGVLKQRELYLTDFDSYRRRIKTCQEKIDKVHSSSPVNQSKLDELQQELTKLQNKYNNAEKNYNEFNLKSKTLLKDSRRKILAYVERHVVTTLTCQAEVFRSATNLFNSILDTMEPSQVDEVRIAMRQSTGEDASDLLPSTTVNHHTKSSLGSSSNDNNDHLKPSAPPIPAMPPPTVPLPPRPAPRSSHEENQPSHVTFEEEEEPEEVQQQQKEDNIPVPTYAPPPVPPPLPSSNPFDD